jgi:hypothetical protein
VSEEAAHEVLPALHGVRSAAGAMGPSVKIKDRVVREGIGFQIGPLVLDGIEFQGIGGRYSRCAERSRTHCVMSSPL